MRILAICGEVLPVLGTVGLLGLWLYQQNGVEHRQAELQSLAAATTVFQIYQSHNALFNAINESAGKNSKSREQLLSLQIYNYELGLAAIESALTDTEKAGIPPAAPPYTQGNIQEKTDRTQQRLEKLQQRLFEKKVRLQQSVEAAKGLYLTLYVAISAFAILGRGLQHRG